MGRRPVLPRSVRVCVDDFGLHPGITAGVLALQEDGVIDATACMVGAPRWRADAPLLRGLPADFEIGLHLDFTECPLRPASRRGLAALIAASHAGGLDAAQVRTEIRAQLDAFEDLLGRSPDFVDGHQHVHQLPVIRDELLHELARRAAPPPWLRSTRRARGLPLSPVERFKGWFIERLGAQALAQLAREQGLMQNRRLLGVYDFAGGPARYAALLDVWVAAARPGDLLMCHPSGAHDAGDPLSAARRSEFAVLSRLMRS
ncbi:ChbG/HpnK family deacetylase [Pelomonas sp. KK5]|uniref:ChbG/HpnK family deacetylase n=1 Tax=Pelomonas sp. KK5 TaxID=1855730 RepID=UPI00097C58B3|nr:ChbG/HpnK family deacetylase [Pelomonas sp. KK5]